MNYINRIDTEYRRALQMRYGIIGDSVAIQEAINILEKVAPTDLPVLINGETGTGKEVFANALHNLSRRKKQPFVSVNCGAIPETLLEAELFGHEKGAFTSAVEQRVGFFESADNGTIFLDEIGEMPIITQVKLLRILESGEYSRLGSSKVNKVDVRIVAATNRNLAEEVQKKNFRQDLFYRLNTVNIILPPLRDHLEDIPLYVNYFGSNICEKNGYNFLGFSEEAIELLKSMPWPGNIREIKNLVEKVVTLEKGEFVNIQTIKKYLPRVAGGFNLESSNFTTALVPAQKTQELVNSDTLILRTLLELKQDTTDIKRALGKIGAALHTISEDIELLKDHTVVNYTEHFNQTKNMTLAEMEKKMILDALAEYDNNKRRAAQALGISERTLFRKLKEYGES